jgi:outer membrane lipoprotein carrier protein
MRRRRPLSLGAAASIAAAVLCVGPGPGVLPATAITGAEVMEKTQEKLESYKSFTARFEKQFLWAALDRSSSREGRMYLRRPNHFRVELGDGSLVVADGQAIWSYSETNHQAIVSPYAGEVQTPWEVFLDYNTRYEPIAVEEAKLGKHECYLLVLRPLDEGQTTQMRVWVDRDRWYLRRVEQLEASGNITTYILSDVRTNKTLEDGLFEFVPPEGTDLIDRRPPAQGTH